MRSQVGEWWIDLRVWQKEKSRHSRGWVDGEDSKSLARGVIGMEGEGWKALSSACQRATG